jgi:NMD protein affecting ribosome stability and mRNA decay
MGMIIEYKCYNCGIEITEEENRMNHGLCQTCLDAEDDKTWGKPDSD